MKPLAYSYVRFSHPSQAAGDSLRRQTELRDAWLARNGVALDTSVTLEDKGVSGYTGAHRDNPDRHALAAFVCLVEKGRVPRGSYLIVESLDRLTREDILPALGLLIDLIQAGVRVVQLLPVETIYDEKVDPMRLMMAIMELNRGHSESAMRSERLGGAWREKKRRAAENGEALTARGPAWLRLVEGRWEVDGPKAEIVRRVYRLATAGYGLTAIVKKLNSEHVPTVGRSAHWPRSYVAKLLADRRPTGEYQPYKGRGPEREPDGDPIPGYFPVIISEQEWYAARAGITQRRNKPGRPSRDHINVFADLIYDALSGGSLNQFCNSKGARMLVSYRAAQGIKGEHCASFPFPTFERGILSLLREVDPGSVLPEPDRGADQSLVLTGRLAEVDGEIEKIKARVLERYTDALADVLERREAERKKLAADLAEARQKAASPLAEAWGECRSLLDALDAAPDPEDARTRLRAALRRIVEGIYCLFIGRTDAVRVAAVQLRFTGGSHRDYLILHKWGTRGAVGDRPSEWHARSLPPKMGIEGLDLRRKKDAKALAKLLGEIDVKGLEKVMRGDKG
jgi:DNA invertase Pin-like site-specific DNA recombinase